MQHTNDGISFIRTPSENFSNLEDFPFDSRTIEIDGLQMAYVDEGPSDAPVVLMVHGMPTWSYLYRHMISSFCEAGFRCIAPDHIGFGRSDKPIDPDWYSIARHTANLSKLITELNLSNITLVVQDWGGPIGLAQYAAFPERFSRLVIMNTWLHHQTYEYSPGILKWIEQNQPGGIFRDNIPERFNWGTLLAMTTGRVTPQNSLIPLLTGGTPEFSTDALAVKTAYDAPFVGLGEAGVAGPRRFPLSIPANGSNADNAIAQQRQFEKVNETTLPVHFVWGVTDNVFTREWGLRWHSLIPHSTWHEIEAGHFLQDTHGTAIAEHVINHASGR
jgi:haloalkane dehalogenase